ncbi:MAG: LuxR C-terminal-related transcriptional regulator [Gallionella sp.]
MLPVTDGTVIRVALVEDDVNFQHDLCEAIAAAPDMVLQYVASTQAQGLAMLREQAADVLLVDLGLPDGSGLEVIRATHGYWPDCNMMVVTTFGDELHVMRSLEAGAAGYLLKDSNAPDILMQIRSLYGGGSPISPLIARQILLRFRKEGVSTTTRLFAFTPQKAPVQLSTREYQVLELTTQGFSTDEIAASLGVSRHTVQTFIRRIYTKLNVKSKPQAIREAREKGFIK